MDFILVIGGEERGMEDGVDFPQSGEFKFIG